MSRDEMMVDPELTKPAMREALRLAKLLDADLMDTKEIYRTILFVAIDYKLEK